MSNNMWPYYMVRPESQVTAYACMNPLDNKIMWIRCLDGGLQNVMMHFLQQLLIIVDPLLKSHKIRIASFAELAPNGRIHGYHCMLSKERARLKNGQPAEVHIKIRLRRGPKLSDMVPLSELLDVLCHELAHSWHVQHDDFFLRKWEELKDELGKDLGGRTKVYMYSEQYADRIKTLVEADRGLPRGKLPFIPEYTRLPSFDSMEAVERWEKKHRVILQYDKTLGAEK